MEKSKTQKNYHQKPVAAGYFNTSDLPKALKPGNHDYFGFCAVEWFVNEMIELENKMKYYFDNTTIPPNMTEEDEEKF